MAGREGTGSSSRELWVEPQWVTLETEGWCSSSRRRSQMSPRLLAPGHKYTQGYLISCFLPWCSWRSSTSAPQCYYATLLVYCTPSAPFQVSERGGQELRAARGAFVLWLMLSAVEASLPWQDRTGAASWVLLDMFLFSLKHNRLKFKNSGM